MYRKLIIIFAFLFFAGMAPLSLGEPDVNQRGFYVVDGTPSAEPNGKIIRVRPIVEGQVKPDTLKLYLQHREPDTPLNTKLAKDADLVFYCYPETLKRDNYALPDAGGVVHSRYDEDSRILILYDTDKFARFFYIA